jgi:N-acetylglucosaminyldiphosphoundecaprenol N-acetyl-beta-D-mannosaminyltransferase
MISNKASASLTEIEVGNAEVQAPPLSPKSDLCGIAYSRATCHQFYGAICRWLRGDRSRGATIGYVNPHVFNLAKKHEAVAAFLDKGDIVAVDGAGFALALWLLKGECQTRTVMTPLFDRVLETGDLPRVPAVLIGGTEDVARQGVVAMNRVSRNIQVVAFAHGYQALAEYHDFLRDHADADVVLVAMGTPRSEEFILDASPLFPGKLFWNIGGGTLQFHAGTLRRVPKIVSTLCLQWLWRMIFEPHLMPRYVIGLPVFARHLLKARRTDKMNGVCSK